MAVNKPVISAVMPAKASTGIEGLDDILCGGFVRDRIFLVEGDPGSGKTTLGLQFLIEGERLGEKTLFVSLSETAEEIREIADSHGWDLGNMEIKELNVSKENLEPQANYTLFHPSEVELTETVAQIYEEIERVKPSRVVFDSISEMRLLAQDPLRYRRQVLALKQFFRGRNATVLILEDRSSGDRDRHLLSVAHGVLMLEQLAPEYGSERRRLRAVKMRGSVYRGGFHDFRIKSGGIEVYPRLVAGEHLGDFMYSSISSGVSHLDELLGGGLQAGTSGLIIGPAGSGKSTLALQYAIACAKRGEKATVFAFDETIATLRQRCEGVGLDLKGALVGGKLAIRQIDPAELSPGEFAHDVRLAVDEGAKIIVIDSLNGYLASMAGEQMLISQLHELLTYLNQKGVLTLIILAQAGLINSSMVSPVDASYLADSVIITRYFEFRGSVRRAISVLKKRNGAHERTVRELSFDQDGIHVSEPLEKFHGVLSGIPTIVHGGHFGLEDNGS